MNFTVKYKTQTVGEKKGQTVYYAQPVPQTKFTTRMLVERIVRETSLAPGDVSNALVSLSNVVCDALRLGISVDLAELGSIRPVVSSKMMDSAADVTVEKALNKPRIMFTPKQQMRQAVDEMVLSIDRSQVSKAGSPTPPAGGSGDPGTDPGTDPNPGGGTDPGTGGGSGDDFV